MKGILIFWTAFLLQACARQPVPPAKTPSEIRTSEAAKNIEIADMLAQRRHYLEASFYYEAALIFTGDETKILPKLIAAQVRSDRLRDARNNVNRLIHLKGSSPALTRLIVLLDAYAPSLIRKVNVEENAP